MILRFATIAAQEFRLARRNLWVALATAALAAFALALGFLGAGQGPALKADVLSLTAASLSTLSVYLIPLIALLMSYDALSGEVERGTLALTFATPARRWELFVAKFVAQTAAVGAAITIGFAIAGGAIGAVYGLSAEGLAAWARLVGSGFALGAVFVAIGLALSAAAGRTANAAAFAIACWLLLVVLYDLALLGGVIAAGEGVFTSHIFPWMVLANPADAFRIYNLAAFDAAPVSGIDGLARTLPFPPQLALAVLGFWLAAPVLLGIRLTGKIVP
ncbi:ABC transporter permease [Thioclava atlantica]|uniref:Membrane protein nosY n=1 Tax=Thioclava atlantica TaxID=1317124 RepID=A0A085U0R3_9RHOB|nr:ABC transporter permease subunit [Thioclava atlantica]KFE36560.1 membrane protein nosY [Thioclava atlantica]